MRKFLKSLLSAALCLVLLISVFSAVTFAVPASDADIYALFDAESGQMLYLNNGTKHVSPSFVSRVVTTLIACETVDPEETVTVTADAVVLAAGASNIGLKKGENVRYIDLMYAAVIYGAEDAANAIGISVSGSLEAFADKMNQRAVQAGATDTLLGNPGGAYEQTTYTTVADASAILLEALENDTFRRICTASGYDLPPNNIRKTVFSIEKSDFAMIDRESPYFYSGALGGAVGYIKSEGSSGFAYVQRGDMLLVSVVFGAKNKASRYSSLKGVLDYGFDNFVRKTVTFEPRSVPVVENGMVVATVGIYAGDSATYLLHKAVSADSVKMDFSVREVYTKYDIAPKVIISLPPTVTQMCPDIGTYVLSYNVSQLDQPYPYKSEDATDGPSKPDTDPVKKGMSLWIKIPLIILAVAAAFAVMLAVLYAVAESRRRKRARERRRRRREAGVTRKKREE